MHFVPQRPGKESQRSDQQNSTSATLEARRTKFEREKLSAFSVTRECESWRSLHRRFRLCRLEGEETVEHPKSALETDREIVGAQFLSLLPHDSETSANFASRLRGEGQALAPRATGLGRLFALRTKPNQAKFGGISQCFRRTESGVDRPLVHMKVNLGFRVCVRLSYQKVRRINVDGKTRCYFRDTDGRSQWKTNLKRTMVEEADSMVRRARTEEQKDSKARAAKRPSCTDAALRVGSRPG